MPYDDAETQSPELALGICFCHLALHQLPGQRHHRYVLRVLAPAGCSAGAATSPTAQRYPPGATCTNTERTHVVLTTVLVAVGNEQTNSLSSQSDCGMQLVGRCRHQLAASSPAWNQGATWICRRVLCPRCTVRLTGC